MPSIVVKLTVPTMMKLSGHSNSSRKTSTSFGYFIYPFSETMSGSTTITTIFSINLLLNPKKTMRFVTNRWKYWRNRMTVFWENKSLKIDLETCRNGSIRTLYLLKLTSIGNWVSGRTKRMSISKSMKNFWRKIIDFVMELRIMMTFMSRKGNDWH